MQPLILDGRTAAQKILERIKAELASSAQKTSRAPGLAVVQVGDHPSSNTYIRHKEKAAGDCGIHFSLVKLSGSIDLEKLKQEVRKVATRSEIDGLIVQLPLDAPHLKDVRDVQSVLESIPPEKDADGLSVLNQGRLFTGESKPHRWTAPLPATPLGIYRLIESYGIEVMGKNVTVVGKSRLVGFPTAGLLSQLGGTVTLCHRRTPDIVPFTKTADILIVAAGVRHLIEPQHLKEGVVIVDVGIHVQDNGKLTGDVHPDCYAHCSAYSPVPGGVGPMTVASLMENTQRLYEKYFLSQK